MNIHSRHQWRSNEREGRELHQMMSPDHFAMMQYNNQLRMQQMFIARQNWQMQLQVLYGNNYTGMQAQQFTMNAMANQQQRFNSAVWRGGINPLNSTPPGSGVLRAYPRTPAGFQQDLQGGPRQYPRTRTERLGEYATQQVNAAGYQPYVAPRRFPPVGTADSNEHLTGFGRRPDEPAGPAPFRRPRGRGNTPMPLRVRNPDYVSPEEYYAMQQQPILYSQPQQKKFQSENQLITGDILTRNPETGRSDISRSYRGARFWEQGRPQTVERSGATQAQRKMLTQLRAAAETAGTPQERLNMLYIAHLFEDMVLFLNRSPRPTDVQILGPFNYLTREIIATDSSGAKIFIDGVTHAVHHDGGTMAWNPSTGWSLTMPGGRVIRGDPRGTPPGGRGNDGINYTSTGSGAKQRYEKGQKGSGDVQAKLKENETTLAAYRKDLAGIRERQGSVRKSLQDIEARRTKMRESNNENSAKIQNDLAKLEQQLEDPENRDEQQVKNLRQRIATLAKTLKESFAESKRQTDQLQAEADELNKLTADLDSRAQQIEKKLGISSTIQNAQNQKKSDANEKQLQQDAKNSTVPPGPSAPQAGEKLKQDLARMQKDVEQFNAQSNILAGLTVTTDGTPPVYKISFDPRPGNGGTTYGVSWMNEAVLSALPGRGPMLFVSPPYSVTPVTEAQLHTIMNAIRWNDPAQVPGEVLAFNSLPTASRMADVRVTKRAGQNVFDAMVIPLPGQLDQTRSAISRLNPVRYILLPGGAEGYPLRSLTAAELITLTGNLRRTEAPAPSPDAKRVEEMRNKLEILENQVKNIQQQEKAAENLPRDDANTKKIINELRETRTELTESINEIRKSLLEIEMKLKQLP